MKKRFPFAVYRADGHRVFLVHHIGKCAVAHVTPCTLRDPFFVVRFRQHYHEVTNRAQLAAAFAHLRQADNDEIAAEREKLAFGETVEQLGLQPSCLYTFCEAHHLDPYRSYRRSTIRRAITSLGHEKKEHYLNLLSKVKPTTTSPA